MTSQAVSLSNGAEKVRVGAATRWVLQPLCASVVVALAAHVAFPLPFTPIPFTLQPLAVLGVALTLAPLEACLALCLYLLEGATGLPVFSPTGPGGLSQLLGPSGGFLLAYPFVAYLCSGTTRFATQKIPSFAAALLGSALGMLLLFACGAFWLAQEGHLTPRQALLAAVLPFLPGESIKILVAAGAYRALGPSTSTGRAR